MSTTELAIHDLTNKVMPLPTEAQRIAIADQGTYDRACRFLQGVLIPMERELDATFDPIIAKAYLVHKEAVAQKKRHSEPILQAKVIIKTKIITWDQEQQRLRQEEQRRLEAEARDREEDERLKAAEAAAECGASAAEVSAILDTPEPVPATVAPPTYQRMEGISRLRENWKGNCTNLLALVCYIAGVNQLAHPELLTLLEANQVAINQTARAQKQLCQIPGVHIWNEPNIAVR